ncbi:MAG: choice-of-anchor I family protein [Pirellulales bacterium]
MMPAVTNALLRFMRREGVPSARPQPRSRSGATRQMICEPLERRDLMAGLQLDVLGTYFAPGAATTEIGAYDAASRRVFYTSATSNALGIVDFSNPATPTHLATIDLSPWGGGPNSVAVKNGLVAVAVEAFAKTDPGAVHFFTTGGDWLGQVPVGALPDMLVFNPDGSKLLVANEGEPNSYNQVGSVDPEGSVSIIDLTNGVGGATVATAGFSGFNGQAASLRAEGVRIFGPNATVAQDLEPEYIALSPDGTIAYVSLQENNAIASIDVATATVVDIMPLGFKNHLLAANRLDASDRDTPGSSNVGILNIRNWPVLGMYQPDAIASFVVNGETYLITANEGDARDYTGFNEEARVSTLTLDAATFGAAGFPDVSTAVTGLRHADNLGRLNVTNTLGNDDADAEFERLFAFGARSFSIWNTDGQQIFDSGDSLEQITAAAFPANFNASNDDNNFDSRSDNKGPEPEAVMIAEIGGSTYAFVGLERIGGIVVFDVTNPAAPEFVEYVNHRDFTQATTSDAALDLGLEDLKFIPAEESPTGEPLVLSVNEISGTISAFAIRLASGVQVTEQRVLEIVGTPEVDRVRVDLVAGQVVVEADFLSPQRQTFPAAEIESIYLLLGDGNDTARIERRVTLPATVEGGLGNDYLTAGGGDSIVLGGMGNDLLQGGTGATVLSGGLGADRILAGNGRAVMIGGGGSDLLLGGREQDLMIGGTTSYDADVDSLAAIRDAWAASQSLPVRHAYLEGGFAGTKGPVRLVAGSTVRDDRAIDILVGGGRFDWLFRSPLDFVS